MQNIAIASRLGGAEIALTNSKTKELAAKTLP
jgi:hypothetical protein